MSLAEIKNKLYKKDLDADLTEHDESEFDAKNEAVSSVKVDTVVADEWGAKDPALNDKRKKTLKIVGIVVGVLIFIALLIFAVYQVRKSSFDESRVSVSVDGPKEARSGKFLTYEISYDNNNWGTLNNVVLRISHPESFKPEDSSTYKDESPTVSIVNLGQLKGHATGKIVFSGKAFIPKGTLIYIKANLFYAPANFSSQFETTGQLGINITSTPMSLEIMAPQSMASGDALDYQINYKNVGEEDFEGIRVKVDFPDGFVFSKAEPTASEGNNIWYIGRLAVGETGKIVISGKLQGERDNIKKVTAYSGVVDQGRFVSFNEEGASTKIVASPLAIRQIVNDSINYSVNAGEELRFEIQYKNEGDLVLRNINIKEVLDSPVLDYSSLDIDGGAYDTDNRTIVWKASDHPELASLAPGQGGVIRFSVKVKDMIPVQTVNDKNFIISSVAKIDSPDISAPLEMNKIIAGNRTDIKLKSKLILNVGGYFTDSLISNSGPIPPVVGQETSYTIHLKAGNVSNDVTEAKMEVILPTGVVMTGKTFPEDGKIVYNERTNSLTWNIGPMQAGDGILNPLREAAFQIKIKPSLDQFDQMVDLVKSVVFSAKDSFTQENLLAQSAEKTTMLREDPAINSLGWKVEK